MSRTLDLPSEAHLWQTSEIPTLVLTEGANPEFQQLLKVEVVELTSLTPAKAWPTYTAWICPLWECGGTLAARAIAEGAVQKSCLYCPQNYWRQYRPNTCW